MTITLYELRPSPHARKIRLLAAELGIPLNKVPVDPRIGETRTPDPCQEPERPGAHSRRGRLRTLGVVGDPQISLGQAPRAPTLRRRCQDPGSGRSVDLLVGRRA